MKTKLTLKKYIYVLALSGSVLMASPVFAQDACVSMFQNALVEVNKSERLDYAFSSLHKTMCSSRDRSFTAGFDNKTDAVIKGVPTASKTLGRLGITNNKQLCEAIDNEHLSIGIGNSYTSKPVVAALDAANQCLRISLNENIEISHTIANPGRVVIKVNFKDDDLSLRFTASTGSFVCKTSAINGRDEEVLSNQELKRSKDFSIECNRKGQNVGGDVDYKEDTIILSTSKSDNYTIRTYPDTLYGITSRNKAETQIGELKSDVDGLNSQINELLERKYTPVRFYTGQKNTSRSYGPRVSCGGRTAFTTGVYSDSLRKRLCPKGELTKAIKHSSRSGNKCGYGYYTAVCIQPND